jgi:ABC-2 type transport system permease protein
MKRVLDIGHNDLRLFMKHRSAFVWLFVVPLAFVYLTGFASRGGGDPSNHKAPVLIENQDTNFLSRMFLEELGAQGMWLVDPTNRDAAARGVRIPADFTARILRQEQAKVEFFQKAGSAEADAALIEIRLVRALIAMNGHLLETAAREGEAGALSEEKFRRTLAAPDPVSLNARFAGRKPVPTSFNFSLPGTLVMYLMMNLLIFGGTTITTERRNGILRRLLLHPIAPGEVIMGKVYGLMLLGVVQILFLLIVGKFLFHVNLGANLPAVAVTLLVFTWVAGSLGVLAGSLFTAEDRVVGICILASLLMAAMGGCWWPLEIGPPALKTLSLCLPTGWALQALHQLISFGSGFGSVLTPLAVLIGFGTAANLLAARFFRV